MLEVVGLEQVTMDDMALLHTLPALTDLYLPELYKQVSGAGSALLCSVLLQHAAICAALPCAAQVVPGACAQCTASCGYCMRPCSHPISSPHCAGGQKAPGTARRRVATSVCLHSACPRQLPSVRLSNSSDMQAGGVDPGRGSLAHATANHPPGVPGAQMGAGGDPGQGGAAAVQEPKM